MLSKIIKEQEKKFDEKFNHDSPNGIAVVIIKDNTQRPAQHELKEFNKATTVAIIEGVIKMIDELKPKMRSNHKDYCCYKKHTFKDMNECDCDLSQRIIVIHYLEEKLTNELKNI